MRKSLAICVEDIGKLYSLGTLQEHNRISELLHAAPRVGAQALSRLMSKVVNRFSPEAVDPVVKKSQFWALRNIDFEVEKGGTLGIVGHNGSGKSTLLKILSKITKPTTGRFGIDGRISSLLEVGTGFHPELTGRENVFLSGTILGMSRVEIRRHFDEIVAFSDIGDFLDTPVKRYSSGMFVRLGFAIAAHLNPEILIVDEVLAVGDAEFQRKCIAKMNDVVANGRTILFVSHDASAIEKLCKNCLLLEHGRQVDYGPTQSVLNRYNEMYSVVPSVAEQLLATSLHSDYRVHDVKLYQDGATQEYFETDKAIEVQACVELKNPQSRLRMFVSVYSATNLLLFKSFNDSNADTRVMLSTGMNSLSASIPPKLLSPRSYAIHVGFQQIDSQAQGTVIRIPINVHCSEQSAVGSYLDASVGELWPRLNWAKN